MTHRILYQPLFGVTLVGVVVCCAVTNALDQAPRRKPQVVHFSQSEPSDAQENEVARENEIVNVSAAAPQRSRERLEGEPSHVVPARESFRTMPCASKSSRMRSASAKFFAALAAARAVINSPMLSGVCVTVACAST